MGRATHRQLDRKACRNNLEAEEGIAMIGRVSVWPAILGLALAMIAVTLIESVPVFPACQRLLVLISLLGWAMEAREVAGPPPRLSPSTRKKKEAPGPSYWPVLLALGVVGIAAGLIYNNDYGALVVAVPLAIRLGRRLG